jgi:cellulose synthase/poly-beta-1,6-N-acetylglucosamine synthase-like glycosyltransferase
LPAVAPNTCPEIDCVRHLLPRRVIAAAEQRARSIGLGADRVLICADAITEEAYLTALAASLGTSYERLDRISRADCPLDDDRLIQAAAVGLLPLRKGRDIVWIIAPRCLAARRLADRGQAWPALLRSFRLTSSERLRRFVALHTRNALGRRAAYSLRRSRPLFSNAPRPHGGGRATALFGVFAVAILALVPTVTLEGFATSLCALFLAAAALRLVCAAFGGRAPDRISRRRDDQLPVYTIICPLYREANVIGELVAAIRALDYPIEKLDVKFVLEADDRDTRRALARLELGPPFEIITAPPIGPRTKPKALNAALAFAHGSYTVVYDAEDVPEPDQLRRALDVFDASDGRLACVQASLTIDNTGDSWLARMFTAGYAGQFDALLPGLAALQLPLPLGGSSNHFRTAALRRVGGWDPYNVTEDADLGIRLNRFGYRSTALSSATYEEAPAHFGPGLRQRTRWYKGWMQTWLVHMRRPVRLARELTPLGALAFQLFLACNVFAALIHPLFMAGLCYSLLAASSPRAVGAMNAAPIFVATFLGGYISTIAIDVIGLTRRKLAAHAWVLVLTPIYWFLLSLAAWRALFQLAYDPQRWEKTEHGLAKSSRRPKPSRHDILRIRHVPVRNVPVAPMTIMETAGGALTDLGRVRKARQRR